MNDQEIIARAKAIMAECKHITRNSLAKKVGVYTGKLNALEKAGLIVLPLKLSYSQAATLGRKKNKVMNGFYIKKPAPWQQA